MCQYEKRKCRYRKHTLIFNGLWSSVNNYKSENVPCQQVRGQFKIAKIPTFKWSARQSKQDQVSKSSKYRSRKHSVARLF